jgi:hypothetical protein
MLIEERISSFFIVKENSHDHYDVVFSEADNMPATGKYAPFRLWILIVAWVLQLLFLIFELGLFIIVALAISLSSTGTNVTYT